MHSSHNCLPRYYSLNEKAITIEFGSEINVNLLAEVTQCNRLLLQEPFPGFITTVPAYASLTVFFDPVIVSTCGLHGIDCFGKVSNYITQLLTQSKQAEPKDNATITIPVCYGGAYGPDLEEVARHAKISTDEVMHLHSKAIYKIYMIGFLPGFAYMGGMDVQLATPRKVTPRQSVPAGSVGIAGLQTGIYPLNSPGGWQLVGQTPITLFDIHNSAPALLKAGDDVKFKPVCVDEFKALAK